MGARLKVHLRKRGKALNWKLELNPSTLKGRDQLKVDDQWYPVEYNPKMYPGKVRISRPVEVS